MKKEWMRYLSYAGLGLFFFVFFLFWTFPYEILKNRIIHQIEDQLGGQYHLKIKEMSAGFFTGFTFKNVEVIKTEGGKEWLMFKTPKLRVNPSWIAWMRNKTSVSFKIQTTQGKVVGTYYNSPEKNEISVEFDSLRLSDLHSFTSSAGLSFKGMIEGDVDLTLFKKDPSKNSGKVDISFVDLNLASFSIKLDPNSPEGMPLPQIQLTGAKNSKLLGEVKQNILEIKELSFKGGQIDLNLKGKITLAPHFEDYRIFLEGKLKPSSLLAQLIPYLVLFEQQKLPDGSFELQVSDSLMNPMVMLGKMKLWPPQHPM